MTPEAGGSNIVVSKTGGSYYYDSTCTFELNFTKIPYDVSYTITFKLEDDGAKVLTANNYVTSGSNYTVTFPDDDTAQVRLLAKTGIGYSWSFSGTFPWWAIINFNQVS